MLWSQHVLFFKKKRSPPTSSCFFPGASPGFARSCLDGWNALSASLSANHSSARGPLGAGGWFQQTSLMEAISGGASVLAFITLAIQSAKTVSTILAGIKDAPDDVRRTAETVSMLQWALEQLAQHGEASRVPLAEGIKDQLRICSENLEAYASKLAKLLALDTDGRGRRVWKRIKAVLDEKELDKMTEIMAAHASTLNLSLQSTQMLDPGLESQSPVCPSVVLTRPAQCEPPRWEGTDLPALSTYLCKLSGQLGSMERRPSRHEQHPYRPCKSRRAARGAVAQHSHGSGSNHHDL